MANEQTIDLLEWKPGKADKKDAPRAWNTFCTKLGDMIKEIPSADLTEFAIITRTPDSEASTGQVIRTSEAKDLVAMVVDSTTEFAAKWFVAYEHRIAVLITVLAGDKRGTHFLLGPNKFPDELQTKLNFMRSMEKAADNTGA